MTSVRKPKVGIVTMTKSENYGTVLQAYATVELFRSLTDELDFTLVPIDSRRTRLRQHLTFFSPKLYRRPVRRLLNYLSMRRFIAPYLDRDVPRLRVEEADRTNAILAANYDAIITGSDEMWNLLFKNAERVYFADPLVGKFRAAFATSANRLDPNKLSGETRQVIRASLEGYDVLAVRDSATRDLVETTAPSAKPFEIVDPTLAHGLAELRRRRSPAHLPNRSRPRLLLMARHPGVAAAILNEYGDSLELHAAFRGFPGYQLLRLEPAEFAGVFADYDIIVTQFFHGTCMSVLSGQPFISFDHSGEYDGSAQTKIQDVLSRLGVSDNYFRLEGTELAGIDALLKRIDSVAKGDWTQPDVSQALDVERRVALDAAAMIVDGIKRSTSTKES